MPASHHRRCAVALLMLVSVVALLGCRRQDAPPSLDPQPENSVQQPRPTLSGAGVFPKSLAPSEDDWPTEAFASRVTASLAELASSFQSGGEIAVSSKRIASEVSVESFNELQVVYDKQSLSVARLRPASQSPMFNGREAREQLVSALSDKSAKHPHFKFKIVGVDVQSPRPRSTVRAEVNGENDGGTFQRISVWEMGWDSLDADRIVSAKVTSVEHVQHGVQSGFVDRTAALLGNLPSFEQQLAYGMQYWLGRIETAHGSNYFSKHGLSIADVNGDGLDDVYVCQPGGLPNRLYIQQADGSVAEQASEFGIDLLDRTASAVFVDLDNDGDQDVAIASLMGVLVYENMAFKRFEIRRQLALSDIDLQGISAIDYDGDGDLDLFQLVDYASSESRAAEGLPSFLYHDAKDGGRNRLFRNDHSSTAPWAFTDVTTQVGLDENNQRHSLAAAWGDVDNDGDFDVYVANDYGPNCLYRNEQGRFSESAEASRVTDFGSGCPSPGVTTIETG